MIFAVLGIAAGIVSLAAYPPYLRDIFKKTTKPERASWFIWMVLAGIALASQIAEGGSWSLLLTLSQLIGVTAIFLLSLKYGEGGLERKDIVSLVVAGIGLLIWALTDRPVLALGLVIIVDAAGAWLTVWKAYKEPETETEVTWLLDSIGGVLAIFAVGSLTPSLLAYPFYLFVANFSVYIAIKFGKAKKAQIHAR